MTNEEKILELLTAMQQDISILKDGQERLELKVTDIDVKLDKLAETQTSDIYTLVKLTHDKVTRLDGKLGILNNRLFEQEADIQVLKLVK